jgi:hypothetical protein
MHRLSTTAAPVVSSVNCRYDLGFGARSDFELNFGRLLPLLDPDVG